eukprot:5774595-Pleurochrysis_carterae.AAC.1
MRNGVNTVPFKSAQTTGRLYFLPSSSPSCDCVVLAGASAKCCERHGAMLIGVCTAQLEGAQATGRLCSLPAVRRPSDVSGTELCEAAFALYSSGAHRLRVGSALSLLFSPLAFLCCA